MSELPQGWVETKLDELVTAKKGKKPKQQDSAHTNGLVPYLDIYAIEKGIIRQYADTASSRLTDGNDILVVWDGARSGWVGKSQAGAIGSTIMALTTKINCTDYLYYFLSSQFDTINSNPRGTGIPHVDPEIFWGIEVPLPPLPEQRRIVAKLEQVLARVDACRARLAQVPTLLKRFRQSILAAACSGRLTEDWREENYIYDVGVVCQLSEVGRVTGGITKNAKRQAIDLQVPYLRVANVYENRLELGDVRLIGVKETELERTQLLKNDVLFVEGNGSIDQIGRVALWDGSIQPCIHQNHIIKFRANEMVMPEYVLLQMMGPEGRAQLVEKATSSAGLNTLSISKISEVTLAVPSLQEQQEIVRRVTALFAFADQVETHYTQAKSHAGLLTQSILAKAFRGELVPQEPADEPATELLARIKAGGDHEVNRKRGRK